jgi:hypothetical protein
MYYFPGRKRSDDSECIPVTPDALSLANGTQFDITGLPDADYDELVSNSRPIT